MPRRERSRVTRAARGLRSLVWRPAVEHEVRDELAFHLEMSIHELMERGMSHDEARAEAVRRFGNEKEYAASCERLGAQRDRYANRAEFRSELAQDVRFALRQLGRTRGFTVVAMLTLALGFGATAAVFSALYAMVLRPLPFDAPERVVTLRTTVRGEPQALSAAEFFAFRDGAREFSHVAGSIGQVGFTYHDGDVPTLVGGGRVTQQYFAVFGMRPLMGRVFSAEEDVPGGPKVAMVSYRFWRSKLASDPAVIGRMLRLDGEQYRVIGVMPADFDIQRESEDIWTPLALTLADAERTGAHYIGGLARLGPNVSLEQARAGAIRVHRALPATRASVIPLNEHAVTLTPYLDTLVGDFRPLLLILLGAVSFVLLIACTNVANLLLSRGAARARELAIRAAIGAGRGRLVRQLLTESLVLSLAGATLGLGLAWAVLRGVRAVSPDGIPRLEHAGIDFAVLAFTLLLAVSCSVIFGLVPALRASSTSLQDTLRQSERAGGGRDRLRGVLVCAEVALAMMLLTGSGLLIRSAWLVQHVDPGFDPRGVLTARIVLPAARYPDATTIVNTYERIRAEAARIPGVRIAALCAVVPLSGSSMNSSVTAEGRTRQDSRAANLRLASPGYFAAMGIPLRAGRDLDARDDAAAPRVTVINEALAHKLWPGISIEQAIGRRIDAVSAKRDVAEYREVVGIVGDLHDAALDKPVEPEFYLPVPQTPPNFWVYIQRSLVVVLRAADPASDPATLQRPLQRAVAAVDPALPLAESRSMTENIRTSLETARFNTLLLSMLGALALVLAMVGVYGVVAYFVTQRTHEIGIRMALGATPQRIWKHVVSRGLTPIVAGVAIGLGLSAASAEVLRSQLYRVTTTDPLTFGAVGVLLLLVSLVATYFPARNAMRVEPLEALNAM